MRVGSLKAASVRLFPLLRMLRTPAWCCAAFLMPAVLMQDVYNYAYGFTLEKGIKCLPQEVAIEMWRLLLSAHSWPLLESWSASSVYLCLTYGGKNPNERTVLWPAGAPGIFLEDS